MAVRIQFFTIGGTGDFELVPPAALDAAVADFDAAAVADTPAGAVRCVGWLSASDDDEERFTDWCDEVDDDLGIGLLQQGLGEAVGLTPPVLAAESVAADGGWASEWSAVLRGALVAAGGGRIGWRTDFDEAGTTGTPDDYPSAGHAAASERT